MNMEQVNESYKLMLKKPISIVREYVDFVMQTQPQSEIQVIPDYPNGWHAIFGAYDHVWTLQCHDGFIGLVDVGTCHGVRPNGNLIPVSDKNGRENAIKCSQWFLEYTEPDDLPLTCECFCDRDEAPCRFCKVAREKIFNNDQNEGSNS